jgi:large conductance mechanosensitive channel
MSLFKEFREFAVRGNMVDMAVGIIIGGAFGKIVESIVQDMIMPVVGRIIGGLDFSSLLLVLGDNPNQLQSLAELKKAGIATFAYGNFITILVNFIILSWVIFMLVKAINRVRRTEPAVAPVVVTPEDIVLLREIRDALKSK